MSHVTNPVNLGALLKDKDIPDAKREFAENKAVAALFGGFPSLRAWTAINPTLLWIPGIAAYALEHGIRRPRPASAYHKMLVDACAVDADNLTATLDFLDGLCETSLVLNNDINFYRGYHFERCEPTRADEEEIHYRMEGSSNYIDWRAKLGY